nr:hypothetical protein Q903MT_gene3609 [Picea sitchensis]
MRNWPPSVLMVFRAAETTGPPFMILYASRTLQKGKLLSALRVPCGAGRVGYSLIALYFCLPYRLD